MKVSHAIVFVGEMKRSVAFYRDVIGLPVKFQSPWWTEFATGEATLALHRAEGPGEKDDPHRVPAARCRPGLHVANLDAFHRRMMEKKAVCVQEPKAQFGVRIAQYLDPDGLGITVSEGKKKEKKAAKKAKKKTTKKRARA